MDVEQLKKDVREGRIDMDRLVGLIATLQRQLDVARERIKDLEQKLGGSPPTKFDEPFSVRAEERRQEARGKNGESEIVRPGGGESPRQTKSHGRCGPKKSFR